MTRYFQPHESDLILTLTNNFLFPADKRVKYRPGQAGSLKDVSRTNTFSYLNKRGARDASCLVQFYVLGNRDALHELELMLLNVTS